MKNEKWNAPKNKQEKELATLKAWNLNAREGIQCLIVLCTVVNGKGFATKY